MLLLSELYSSGTDHYKKISAICLAIENPSITTNRDNQSTIAMNYPLGAHPQLISRSKSILFCMVKSI